MDDKKYLWQAFMRERSNFYINSLMRRVIIFRKLRYKCTASLLHSQ